MSIYGTLAGADTYHAERGNTGWTGDDADKEIALLRGSEYIDAMYRSSFPGEKTNGRDSATPQDREWPRTDAYDIEGAYIPSDTVPIEVIYASYEAALRELENPGFLQPDYNPANQNKREKVDVIEVEKMAPYGPQSVLPVIGKIQGIIAPVLTGGSSSRLSGTTVRI